jgi:hypothetical protein
MSIRDDFRFSIKAILFVMTICAIGFAALRSGEWLWTAAWFTLVLAINLSAVLGAIYRRGGKRAFWTGFALFGWTYLTIEFVPSLRMADYELIGRHVNNMVREFFPRAGDSTVTLQTSNDMVRSNSFNQIVHSACGMLFATAGALIGAWFYHSGDRKER